MRNKFESEKINEPGLIWYMNERDREIEIKRLDELADRQYEAWVKARAKREAAANVGRDR